VKKEPDWHAIHFNQRDPWVSVGGGPSGPSGPTEPDRRRSLLERCEAMLSEAASCDECGCKGCGYRHDHVNCSLELLLTDLRKELGK